MKKAIFTLVLFVVTTIAVAHPGSVLNLSVYGNSFFTVQLDHQYYGNPDRFYSIRSVIPGRHYLKVIRHSYTAFGIRQRQIFEGFVNIPVHAAMNAVVDRYGRLNITSVQPLFAENNGGNIYDPYADNCNDDYGMNYDYSTNQNCATIPSGPVCMDNNAFNDLRASIASKSFESTRLQIAKQALNYNYLSAAQVNQLLSVFNFESTKLDFAKAAFAKTIDKQNYYLTYAAFSFESSIDDLIRYTNTAG